MSTPTHVPRSQGPQRVMKAAALRTEPIGVGRTPAPGAAPSAYPSTTPFGAPPRAATPGTRPPAVARARATPAPSSRPGTAPPQLAPRPRYMPKSTRPQGGTQPSRPADEDPPTSWRLLLAMLAAIGGITVVFWYQAQNLMMTIR